MSENQTTFVHILLDRIEREGPKTEGTFRIAGLRTETDELLNTFDESSFPKSFDSYSVHVIVDTLKGNELKTRDVNLQEVYDFMKHNHMIFPINLSYYAFADTIQEGCVGISAKMNYEDLLAAFKSGHDVSLDSFSSAAMTAFALQTIHEKGPILDHRTDNTTDLMFNLQPLVQNLVSAEDRALVLDALLLLKRLRADVKAPPKPRITSGSGEKFGRLLEKVTFVNTAALARLINMQPATRGTIFN